MDDETLGYGIHVTSVLVLLLTTYTCLKRHVGAKVQDRIERTPRGGAGRPTMGN